MANEGVSPVVEEPTQEPTDNGAGQTADSGVNVNELLETLKGLNVETPQDVINMATASQQTGRVNNLLGEERRARQQLEAQVMALTQQLQTRHSPEPDYYGDSSASVNPAQIEDAVTKAITKLQMEQNRAQQEATARWIADENRIESDRDYNAVKQVWNTIKESGPVRQRLATGQSNLWDEYNNVRLSWYRGIAEKSKTAIETLTKSKGSKTPPHMESGDAQSVHRDTDEEDGYKQRRKLTDPNKGYRGTQEELEALVRTFITGA